MRVLVTGGTGFIGRALIQKLIERGDTVTAFTRRVPDGAAKGTPASAGGTSAGGASAGGASAGGAGSGAVRSPRWVKWDPSADGAWQDELRGQDAVVHLAGETAAGRRFTDAVKQEILNSRVASTQRIVAGIERAQPRGGSVNEGTTAQQNGKHESSLEPELERRGGGEGERPRVLVCASGVGFYGGREDAMALDETAPAGSDFLAQVCVAWEAAAREAQKAGVRVVSGRIGFVLGNGGGALSRLVPIFKAFAGGPLGSGHQMVSWIHIDDVVAAFMKAIDSPALTGPMNVTAPNPVSNKEFSKALGRALGRPALFPAPKFAMKTLFGEEGAEPLLTGQAAVPKALLAQGFEFRFTDVDSALRDLLGR